MSSICKKSLVLMISAGLLVGAACTKKDKPAEGEAAMESKMETTATESPAPAAPAAAGDMKVEDLKVGTGAEATDGKKATVHYTGWLTDGKKFDSSWDRGEPIAFELGAGRVIKGWDEGIAGMKVGQKRTLIIPSHMGYGPYGAGGVIPRNATLVFDVELLGVK